MTVLFLLISINIDSLVTGFSYGMRRVHIPFFSAIIISFFSVFYSSVTLLIGTVISGYVNSLICTLISSILLLSMGIFIIFSSKLNTEHISKSDKRPLKPIMFSIKSLGLTVSIMRDPALCDFDLSNVIEPREAIYLGFALSADAIGVGLACALIGISSPLLPFCIGASQIVLLYSGLAAGYFLSKHIRINKTVCSLFSGVLLIFMAILKLFQKI